ncbi:MAG: nucleotidyltransferase domain-containing protein [Thermodesulfovibrionales bacterium]|nr:nucleotidyltransferase domain-containing protein [Thermodesulfovibrionales bacterium]
MFKEEIKDLNRKVKKLRTIFGDNLLYVVVFGSRVRGDFIAESDMDVLVVLDKRDFQIELKVADVFYKDPFAPYSLMIWDRKTFSEHERLNSQLFREIMQKGKIIFDYLKGTVYDFNNKAKIRAISNKS